MSLSLWNFAKAFCPLVCASYTLLALYVIPKLTAQLRTLESALDAHRAATEKARQIGRSVQRQLNVAGKTEPYLDPLLTELDTVLAPESIAPSEARKSRALYSREGALHFVPEPNRNQ